MNRCPSKVCLQFPVTSVERSTRIGERQKDRCIPSPDIARLDSLSRGWFAPIRRSSERGASHPSRVLCPAAQRDPSRPRTQLASVSLRAHLQRHGSKIERRVSPMKRNTARNRRPERWWSHRSPADTGEEGPSHDQCPGPLGSRARQWDAGDISGSGDVTPGGSDSSRAFRARRRPTFGGAPNTATLRPLHRLEIARRAPGQIIPGPHFRFPARGPRRRPTGRERPARTERSGEDRAPECHHRAKRASAPRYGASGPAERDGERAAGRRSVAAATAVPNVRLARVRALISASVAARRP